MVLGAFCIVASLIATAGDSYSPLWGDMWAIVCFACLVVICVCASVITWSEISKLKNSPSNNFIKRQVLGSIFIVNLIAFWCLYTVLLRSNELTMDDGAGRRYVFLVGTVLLLAYSLLNVLYSAFVAVYSSRKRNIR